RVASRSGILPARVIYPANLSGLAPLVVLHGISRNAATLVDLFRPAAAHSGRAIVVPHFSAKSWPHFQRPCRAARPDQALLALLVHLATVDPAFAGPVDLCGHSGGAQLAHRFAMLYPHKVGQLNIAAAGWYCLPDTRVAYPYGLGDDGGEGGLLWARRYAHGLPAFLRLGVQVFVGTDDVARDDSLRQTPDLDQLQGQTRLARAETYVSRFRAAALARGIKPAITLTRLPGVAHDVEQAIQQGGLAERVTAPGTFGYAQAS
ncbi:alpha/beta hydrolase, partial [Yoonia sp.]|uniref:alpha/beta hydrolase n=1 Tax=Yoonia sp. TaxID=2212373 RepID=UPI0019E1133D